VEAAVPAAVIKIFQATRLPLQHPPLLEKATQKSAGFSQVKHCPKRRSKTG
jgi:hypothetical protein